MSAGELPSGTVTFCFTDIERSTELFRSFGHVFEGALERHREIIRTAFADYAGAEIRAEGDGFFYAFAEAADAARACLIAQREMSVYAWPEGCAIRVRMGLHTGWARPRGRDYISLAVHQAARVGDAGHGGQIVLSSSTLAALDVPEGCEIGELGPHRLKGFDEPLLLYQLSESGRVAEFPPLRVPAVGVSNLPSARDRFIGRESLVAEVGRALADERLVTLVGPGGVGKTRTSLEVVRRGATRFRAGVWFVELAPLATEEAIVSAVADVIGCREDAAATVMEQIAAILRGGALLILDNCEHLADAAARVADELLERCPDVTLLATSREALRVPGETVVRLSPLDSAPKGASAAMLMTSEAVALFADRARHVRPGFAIDESNVSTVAAIVSRLDGLPLAIELAAARIGEMGLEALLKRLDDRLGPLHLGARTRPERQRTLESTIAWGYDLLPDSQRRIFAQLSIFPWMFDATAVREVLEDPNVERALEELAAKSLLVSDLNGTEPRYRMLETIRAFAAKRLADAGELEPTGRRHFEWCLRTAAEVGRAVDRPNEAGAVIGSGHLVEDWRAALRWGLEHGEFADATLELAISVTPYYENMHRREGKAFLDAAIAASPGATSRLRAVALRHAGRLAYRLGQYEEAETYSRTGLAIAQELGDRELEARCLNNIGAVARDLGRYDVAHEHFSASRAIAAELGDPLLEANCLSHLGTVVRPLGDYERARMYFGSAAELAASVDDPDAEVAALNRLAYTAWSEGDDTGAERYAKRALEIMESTGRPDPYLIDTLGVIAWTRNDLDAAATHFDSVVQMAEEAGDRFLEGYGWLGLARVSRREARLEEAAVRLQRVLEIAGGLLCVLAVEETALLAVALARFHEASMLAGAADTARSDLRLAREVPIRGEWQRLTAVLATVSDSSPAQTLAEAVSSARRFVGAQASI